MNIRVVFRKPKGSMSDFGLRVASDYQTKYTTVGFTSANEIFVDRDQSGYLIKDTDGKNPMYTGLKKYKTKYGFTDYVNVIMQVLVDRNSVEAIFDNTYSMTNLIFPENPS